MKGKVKKTTVNYLLIPIVTLVFVTLLELFGAFNYLELKSLDLRYKLRGETSLTNSDIVIIAIDEQSYGSLKEKYPYPRSYYAKLVENLTEAGISQIIFDIEFTHWDEGREREDSLFAASIRRAGNVILAGTIIRNIEKQYDYFQPPTDLLRKNALTEGLVNDIHDEDGFVRKYNIFVPCQNRIHFTLGTLGYIISRGLHPHHLDCFRDDKYCVIADTVSEKFVKIPTARRFFWQEQSFRINYYGPAGSFPYYSLSQVLDDAAFDLRHDRDNDYMEIWKRNSIFPNQLRINFLNDENRLLAEQVLDDEQKVEAIIQRENPFRGKIAFVGSSLPELHDERYTPFYHFSNENRMMPGVEIHAHALQTMLDRNYLKKNSIFSSFLIILMLNYLLVFGVKKYRPLKGSVLTFGMIVLVSVCGFFLFSLFNMIFPLVLIIASMVVTFFSVIGLEFFNEEKEKRKIRKMFQTYTSSKVLKYLEENPESFSLKGERREATILFSDIAGFTTISENLPAEELSSLLNSYLTPMTHIMMKYDGYVDKYQGDGIMCNFGVPIVDEDHAWKACYSALEQLRILDELRPEFQHNYGVDINIRIGINTGLLSAGNMGSEERFQYSVIGDVVNQAARFESANKIYGTRIMVGEDTYKKCQDKIAARLLDKIVVKGKAKPVKVYNIINRLDEVTETQQNFIKYYNRAMQYYFDKEWQTAIENFQEVQKIRKDSAALTMISRCQKFLLNPPPEKWAGEYTLLSK